MDPRATGEARLTPDRRGRRSVPVLPCPACGDVRHSAGPDGAPQRRCWACGHVWLPADAAADAAAVLQDPAVRAALERLDGRVVRLRRRGR